MHEEGQAFAEPLQPCERATAGIRRLIELRMYDQAFAQCRQALERDPDDGDLHRLAGVAALAAGKLKEAGLHLEAAVRADPESPDAHFHLSRYWSERGFLRRAEEAAERALALCPEAGVCWNQLAWISYKEGDFAKARTRVQRALELDPDDAAAANLLAVADAECADGTKWDPEAQVKALRDLLADNPEDAALHHNLGLVYFEELSDYEVASKHFATAVELNPGERRSREYLGKCIRRQSLVLRCLYWPWLLVPHVKRFRRRVAGHPFGWMLSLVVLLLALIPAALILVPWAVALWPVAKGYEFLTIAEERRAMRVLGAPGLLRIHHWPFVFRFSLFLSGLVAFWVGLVMFWHVQAVRMLTGLFLGLVLAETFGYSVRDACKTFWRGLKS